MSRLPRGHLKIDAGIYAKYVGIRTDHIGNPPQQNQPMAELNCICKCPRVSRYARTIPIADDPRSKDGGGQPNPNPLKNPSHAVSSMHVNMLPDPRNATNASAIQIPHNALSPHHASGAS